MMDWHDTALHIDYAEHNVWRNRYRSDMDDAHHPVYRRQMQGITLTIQKKNEILIGHSCGEKSTSWRF